MSDKVEFPGGWAKLRDPRDVTERQRRPLAKVQRLLAGSNVGDVLMAHQGEKISDEQMGKLLQPYLADDAMDLFEDSDDHLIVALVEEWSFDKPISLDTVQDLPARAYDALRDACRPLLGALLGAPDDSDIEDPDSTFPDTSG